MRAAILNGYHKNGGTLTACDRPEHLHKIRQKFHDTCIILRNAHIPNSSVIRHDTFS